MLVQCARSSLKTASIHCVVDLSAVRVFEQVGAYVVLLIFQKQEVKSARPVLVVRCNDLVGAALEDALQDREVRTPAYDVYWSAQPSIGSQQWELAPPERVALYERTASVPKLGDIVEVRQGLITGADDIFVLPSKMIPKAEREIYIPFLADREITPYKIGERPKAYVFYPFHGDHPLREDELQEQYPSNVGLSPPAQREAWMARRARLKIRGEILGGVRFGHASRKCCSGLRSSVLT